MSRDGRGGGGASKRVRARYRGLLKEHGLIRQTRFAEHMDAVIAGGSRKCMYCGLVTPAPRLEVGDVCGTCAGAQRRVLRRIAQSYPGPLEPGVVYVDASWDDGVAGLAIVGEVGEHTRAVLVRSSTAAEVMALRWAFEIAREQGRTGLIFRTDCTSAAKQQYPQREGTVEWVPRRLNGRADRAAYEIRTEQSGALTA